MSDQRRNPLRQPRSFGDTSMDLVSPRELLLMLEVDGHRNVSAVSLAARRASLDMLGEVFTDAQARQDVARLEEEGAIVRTKARRGTPVRSVVYRLSEAGERALAMTQRRMRLLSDLTRTPNTTR